MTPAPDGQLESYLHRLGAELRKHGLADAAIVEEARGHLVDAIEDGVQRGLTRDGAEAEALSRFGGPETVAAHFAVERHRLRDRWLLGAAALFGLLIAYVDSRPTWDDAGITALAMFLSAQIFGLMSPRRPWLWALAVGIWIPLHAVAGARSTASLGMFVVLAFPILGAYLGSAIRRASPRFGSLLWLRDPIETRFAIHDRPAFAYHVRAKRAALKNLSGTVDAPPSESGAREQLTRFLTRPDAVALARLGSVESLTLIEETTMSGKHVRKYLAAFAGGARTTWTIVQAADGRIVSIDGTNQT